MSQLVTGEAVALDLRPAALPSRLVAALVDGLLQLAVLVAVVALAALGGAGSDAADQAIGVLVLVLVLIVYPVSFETALRGRTPGKSAMGLRVVRDDGGPVGFRHALVRGLAGAVLERPGVTLGLAAVVSSLLSPSGKRLGDLLAGTVVLQERVPARRAAAATVPAGLEPWAASLDLTGLPDALALQARAFLARAGELRPEAREEIGRRLVRSVLDRVSPPPPPGVPGWAVLSAVLAERRRRAEGRPAAPAPAPLPAPVLPPPPDGPRTSERPPAPPSGGFALPG